MIETVNRFSVKTIREQFPILNRTVKGKPLVYFDNAATTQKPLSVIEAIDFYYRNTNANVHRGIHTLSEEGTLAMESSRDYLAQHLGIDREELIFTKGTTEGINLIASSFGSMLKKGDEIIITEMEHHANIVPWQLLCQRAGTVLRVAKVTDKGELDIDHLYSLINAQTRLISLVHTSNTLGTINPVEDVIEKAHERNIRVHVDGAQALGHSALNLRQLDVDFFTASAHKAFGPTGIGLLYAKRELLEEMPPYQSGGEMIFEVSFDGTSFNQIPYKFEAGTPNIAGAIVFQKAIEWMNSIGSDVIQEHEHQLLERGTERLKSVDGLKIIGEAANKAAVISFVVEGVHHQDLALFLDANGIAVRTGHHCTMPLMQRFGISGTTRASFAPYNTLEEVDFFADTLEKTIEKLR